MLQIEEFLLNGARSNVRTDSSQFGKFSLDLVVDAIVDAGDGREERWFKHLAIIREFEDISTKKTNFSCADQRTTEENLFERVCQW